QVVRINQGDDAVQMEVLLQSCLREEGLDHRPRVGEAGRLDKDAVEFESTLRTGHHQLLQCACEVPAHGAADASVCQLDHRLGAAAHEEFGIDADSAVLVLDHG